MEEASKRIPFLLACLLIAAPVAGESSAGKTRATATTRVGVSIPALYGINLLEEDTETGGSSWAVVLLEVEPVRIRGQGSAMAEVTARIAVPVFVTVEGTERPDLRVEEMSAVQAAPDRIEWEGLVENRGNTVLKVSGVLPIEERDEELATGDLEDVLILPGFHKRVGGVVTGDFRKAAKISGRLWIRFGPRAGEVMQADCAVLASAGSEQPGRAF